MEKSDNELIRGILESMLTEFEKEDKFYKEMITALLIKLLVQLHRLFINQKSEPEIDEG